MATLASEACWLGVDFGTSGARAITINAAGDVLYETSRVFASDLERRAPLKWRSILFELLCTIPQRWRSQLAALAINGTSSTVLLCDAQGEPLVPPLMYNDQCDHAVLERLAQLVPVDHGVCSASSSFAKLLTLQTQPEFCQAQYFMHQADWLAALLHGYFGISDYHNSLKLGYDPAAAAYPDWFKQPELNCVRQLLPQVVSPGTVLGQVLPQVATLLELPQTCQICAGTTDSIAAFLASPATQPGEAVTSLGSTLALKLLSKQRVDCAAHGIYSHRFGHLWLAGGASNTGGAVLVQFFTPADLAQLSAQINPHCVSPLFYYPLLRPGERFPINDPTLLPQLEPRPNSAVEFLHGLLESLARIEAQGYQLLQQQGASALQRVFTAGGGAQNETWRLIRQRYLQVPVGRSPQTQAAYGTACLALRQTAYATPALTHQAPDAY